MLRKIASLNVIIHYELIKTKERPVTNRRIFYFIKNLRVS